MAALLAHKSAPPTALLDAVVAAFDWLHAGFLISNTSGQLLFANDAAGKILAAGDGLVLDESGRLTTKAPAGMPGQSSAGDFRSLLALARKRKGLIVSVARRHGRLPLTLTMRPTHPQPAHTTDTEAGTVLVLLHDPERSSSAGLMGLRELYGLTMTEARLANLLMQGKTIEDCTGLLGIRRTTVKMHLRNLYGKTGVQRQSELVALLFTSFGNIRCSEPVSSMAGKIVPDPETLIAGCHSPGEREAC
jgi:DNA-binding CsgD family transcriptional regulator